MAILIGVSAWLSLTLARGPGELSAVWIGNGIFAGWLLSRPTHLWPGYLAMGFAAELTARLVPGDPVLQAVALSACDLIEVLIIAIAIRRRVPDVGEPGHWLTLGGIATASTLVACAVSGLLAATVIAAMHAGRFFTNFITWYSAHVVGMVFVGTTTLVAQREGLRLVIAPGRRWSFARSMLLIALVGIGAFYFPYPVGFLVYPPLLMAAFQHRFAGVAAGVTLLAIIGSVATVLGRGPFWLVEDIGTAGRIALLQIYIAGGCLMTIPVALTMAERKRLAARVRDSEQRYRMLADYSNDVVVRMRADGERLYVSPSARDILGWEPAEMLGSRWELVHPDDRAAQVEAMADVIATGKPHTEVYRMRHKAGHYVWVEVVTRPMPSADVKGAMDIIYAGRDISRRVAAEQALEASRLELEKLARVDTLTGLANRRQFDERLSLALLRLRRHGLPVALMYLDVDHFKRINDNFGHAAGDAVLRTFAQRLLDCTRASDLVARQGGDEFVVLIEDAELPAAAEVIARKLIATMGADITVEGTTLQVTTSIGIAYASQPTEAATLMSGADAALYAAKKAGRNTCRMQCVDDAETGGLKTDARKGL
ncbi:sensor domain-containing diguanylate cyclase [Lysobacter sp. CFH 32150]|uniref:sensor domain-containing diguanylate cyclase n=1 Tax=Lysobacter sp. CFH 32150 TaxID=2927128 RepID=UPI001FA745B2|nr:sensor domain-containing diguanylate cyclase [Lysobacter sp. CFH 32150]MCI4568460.1 diguanylate cyclase [Lysobacter sp. CFH 32150]